MHTANQNSPGKITYRADGNAQCFEGAAVNIFRAATLASSLRLYATAKIRPTRHVGPMDMLRMASGFTGKAYKRGQYEEAAADVFAWVQQRKSETPSETLPSVAPPSA